MFEVWSLNRQASRRTVIELAAMLGDGQPIGTLVEEGDSLPSLVESTFPPEDQVAAASQVARITNAIETEGVWLGTGVAIYRRGGHG